MKRFSSMFFILSFTLITVNSAMAQKISVRDMTGRHVTLAENPKRIICIAPGTLRLIIYLNAGERLVGVEDIEKRFPLSRPYWIANSDLASLPTIGPGGVNSINKEPDLEAILGAAPDLIFISYMERRKADDLQKKLGIPVVVLSYGPFGSVNDTIYDSLRVAGRILGKEDRAGEVIAFIEDAKRDLLERVKGVPEKGKPGVYVGGIGFKWAQGIGSTEASYAPFEWVKARNVAAAGGKGGHLFMDREKLLAVNPDIIFIDGGGHESVRQDFEKKRVFYTALDAFRQKRVYNLHSYNWYLTNMGTVVSNAYAVGKILYPERFADVDPRVRADEIYTFLVGKPVYRQLERNQGPLGQKIKELLIH